MNLTSEDYENSFRFRTRIMRKLFFSKGLEFAFFSKGRELRKIYLRVWGKISIWNLPDIYKSCRGSGVFGHFEKWGIFSSHAAWFQKTSDPQVDFLKNDQGRPMADTWSLFQKNDQARSMTFSSISLKWFFIFSEKSDFFLKKVEKSQKFERSLMWDFWISKNPKNDLYSLNFRNLNWKSAFMGRFLKHDLLSSSVFGIFNTSLRFWFPREFQVFNKKRKSSRQTQIFSKNAQKMGIFRKNCKNTPEMGGVCGKPPFL